MLDSRNDLDRMSLVLLNVRATHSSFNSSQKISMCFANEGSPLIIEEVEGIGDKLG